MGQRTPPLMATLHTGILTDPGESERRRGPELRNNFCPVKNLSGARLRSRSLFLPLSLFTPERAFLKSTRLWRESEPACRFFPLLVTPASHPPFKIREILKKRPGDAESFHDVFFVRVGGAFPLGNCYYPYPEIEFLLKIYKYYH